jgi:hypothetical protein
VSTLSADETTTSSAEDAVMTKQELQQLYQDWSQHPEKFETLLQRSLQRWKAEGRKGIWIHAPRDMAGIVPVSSLLYSVGCKHNDRSETLVFTHQTLHLCRFALSWALTFILVKVKIKSMEARNQVQPI